jgi:hypothetical protein
MGSFRVVSRDEEKVGIERVLGLETVAMSPVREMEMTEDGPGVHL